MAVSQPHRIKSISEFHEFRDLPKPEHPLVSVYNFEDLKYLNKTIEVTGKVTKETDSVITLENTVFCLLNQKTNKQLINTKVTVKGKCIGYDELFQEGIASYR